MSEARADYSRWPWPIGRRRPSWWLLGAAAFHGLIGVLSDDLPIGRVNPQIVWQFVGVAALLFVAAFLARRPWVRYTTAFLLVGIAVERAILLGLQTFPAGDLRAAVWVWIATLEYAAWPYLLPSAGRRRNNNEGR